MHASSKRQSLSMVELLVVVALVAIVLTATAVAIARPSVHRDAEALARTLSSARWLAVSTGVPTALIAHDDALYRSAGAPLRCDVRPTGTASWTPSRPLTLTWPAAGLAFGAHGRPLRCDGSAVGNATITLTGRDGSRAAVIVASLGRVRWERR